MVLKEELGSTDHEDEISSLDWPSQLHSATSIKEIPVALMQQFHNFFLLG